MRVRNLILGGGPTGLGAAWRFNERGEGDWLLLERGDTPGGLAGSVLDEKGYTWDFGGHVQFSHYDYFDGLMRTLLAPDEWLTHERESWVWIRDRFVPYPFQNNLRFLPREEMWECVRGLVRLIRNPPAERPKNFGEWAYQTFGEGLCNVFMQPYNFKVWAYPLEEMAYGWIGERVAVTDLERVLENIFYERDDVSWGPNNTFQFPLRGGTGEIWRRCGARLPSEKVRLRALAERVDTHARKLWLKGESDPIEYENLISTVPLDRFIGLSDLAENRECIAKAGLLRHSSTNIIGVGVQGKPKKDLETMCWMYFPESNSPFYRATVFSNYSPNNVPDIEKGWSLMCEVSESPARPVDHARAVEETVDGVVASKLAERSDIVHTFYTRFDYGYPTPSLHRDEALDFLLPLLQERGVYSRGRFGAWKYEVSNQDHSLMQGVECANHLLDGSEEMTVWKPEIVNLPRPAASKNK
jgi:protoporphyrinogen oxidase